MQTTQRVPAAARRDASAARSEASREALHDALGAAGNDASRPGESRRLCTWCENPIPGRCRRDAVCYSVRCRQAQYRFLRAARPRGGRRI
jgi:hypothetical protein